MDNWFCVAIGFGCMGWGILCLKEGVVHGKGMTFKRVENPISYWLSIAFYFGMGALGLSPSIYNYVKYGKFFI